VSQGAAEADDRHLRLRAEFDNYRRRTAKEHEAARREGRHFYDGVAATHRLFQREAGAEPIAEEPADRWR